jgi:peptidoglycan/xylan/chitin deacetylase (PgdA/CDA1 family)
LELNGTVDLINSATGNRLIGIRTPGGNAIDFYDSTLGSRVAGFDQGGAAADVGLLLWDFTAGTLKRVSRGAVDSGGAGFRLLRVAN